jgi:hypothetical protein
MYDIGFPPALLRHIGESIARSKTVVCLVSYHKESVLIQNHNFSLKLIETLPTSMIGKPQRPYPSFFFLSFFFLFFLGGGGLNLKAYD